MTRSQRRCSSRCRDWVRKYFAGHVYSGRDQLHHASSSILPLLFCVVVSQNVSLSDPVLFHETIGQNQGLLGLGLALVTEFDTVKQFHDPLHYAVSDVPGGRIDLDGTEVCCLDNGCLAER